MTVESLHSYKGDLSAGLNKNLSEFEKNFFLISAGIFAFTVTFIKDIIKVQETEYLFFLFFSWGLMALSIGLIMFAFLLSASKNNEIWKCVDDFINTNNYFDPKRELKEDEVKKVKSDILGILDNSKKKLGSLRTLASLSFIAGILSFASFVAFNLILEKNRGLHNTAKPDKEIRINTKTDTFHVKYNDTLFEISK